MSPPRTRAACPPDMGAWTDPLGVSDGPAGGPPPTGAYYCGVDFNNPNVSGSPYGGIASVMGCRIGNDTSSPAGAVGAQYAGLSTTGTVFVAGCDLIRNGPGGAYLGTPSPASAANRTS